MGHGHSTTCADAVRTTPTECTCTCRGRFHGGPNSERARALVWEPAARRAYSRTQVTHAKRRANEALRSTTEFGTACTDFAVTHAIDMLITTTDSAEQDRARDALATVVTPFVQTIVDAALEDGDFRRVETIVNHLHVLCVLCAAALELLDEAGKLASDAADGIVDSVIESLEGNGLTNAVVKAVLRAALRRSFVALVTLAAGPAQVRLIQLVGFISCPNCAEHSEVERYCVAPLAKDYVTEAVQEWIQDGFPAEARILQRAPRRRRS